MEVARAALYHSDEASVVRYLLGAKV